MTGFEIKMDGVKYFVTAMEGDFSTTLTLYLNTMRSNPIYTEDISKRESKVDIKEVKKFIKRALAK